MFASLQHTILNFSSTNHKLRLGLALLLKRSFDLPNMMPPTSQHKELAGRLPMLMEVQNSIRLRFRSKFVPEESFGHRALQPSNTRISRPRLPRVGCTRCGNVLAIPHFG
jgi:hypothetical protein